MLPRETRRNQGFLTRGPNPLCCTQDCAFVHVLRLLKGTAPPRVILTFEADHPARTIPADSPQSGQTPPNSCRSRSPSKGTESPLPLVSPRAQGSTAAIVFLWGAPSPGSERR
ncbi:unnamed protein product, partial [Rangifer tarandus platyrhynchus]